MKPQIHLLLFPVIAVLSLFAAGCTTVRQLDSTQYDVILVPQEIKDPTRFETIQKDINRGQPVIFKVAQGERLPFKLTMDLPMGTLEKSESTFAYKRDTFFLLSQKGMELSPDGQRWANIARPRSIAKLFGFAHGEFSFGFSSSTNEPPYMHVNIKTK